MRNRSKQAALKVVNVILKFKYLSTGISESFQIILSLMSLEVVFLTHLSRNPIPFKAPSVSVAEEPPIIYMGSLDCLFPQKGALMIACVGEL